MPRSHRFLIQSHKKAGNQDASPPPPCCLFVAPTVSSQSEEPKFLSFIVSHHPPPSLLTSSSPPSPLFSLLSVNPPRPDYEVGASLPFPLPPSHQLNLLSEKGGGEGVLLLRQVFLTIVSGKLNKSLEHFGNENSH